MKKIMIITMVMMLCCLGGCRVSDSDKNKKPSSTGKHLAEESLDKSQNTQTDLETEYSEKIPVDGIKPDEKQDSIISDRDENHHASATTDPVDSNSSPKNNVPDKTLQSQSSKQEPTGENEIQNSTSNAPTQKEEPVPEVAPPVKNAGKSDERAVAEKVLEYINGYREVPAISLPGLAEYAQYRSRQLVSNFAHDTNDQRVAATALQYGEYMDPALFGGSGEPYYRANAREAIAKAGYVGSIDYVAGELAKLVYQSKSHWSYIGASEYGYIAVGITYQSDMWYCAITVAAQNTDEL